MSLLTDLEIRTIAGQDPGTASLEILVDTATELTLKAVAEWASGNCDVETHTSYGGGRASCPLCLANLILSAGEGKLPGEAD